MSLLLASLAMAQLAAADAPQSLAQARLEDCLEDARRDPPTAIVTASDWLEGLGGEEVSYPQQCLGHAYVSLLRWDAAVDAFRKARDARSAADGAGRARLGAMAGNAALASGNADRAMDLFLLARGDAGETALGGQIAADMARAYVQLQRAGDAEQSLDYARRMAPQYVESWLLSAALMRRMERLDEAQAFIATAGELAPQDGEVALEAGVIAALRGDEATARKNFEAVEMLEPGSGVAATAQGYLDQLDGGVS